MPDLKASYWNRLAAGDPDAAVLDPLDRLGHKNRYIAAVRDAALEGALGARVRRGDLILDFGCGSGSCTALLCHRSERVIGVDISIGLLRRAMTRPAPNSATFVLYDGLHLPLRGARVDTTVIYVVLTYVDCQTAVQLLRSIREITRPGGQLVMIEQTTRSPRHAEARLKHFRTVSQWKDVLAQAGWLGCRTRHVRFGRFPLIPVVRSGLIATKWFPTLIALESWLGRRFGPLPFDYAETLFEANA